MYETILVEVKDRVATITLNRPDFGNAFMPESYVEVKKALTECAENDDVGAIVLTGAGKHFSAGGDIKRFKRLVDSKEYLSEGPILAAGSMSTAVKRCPKPVIAMINGAAAGAGCSLALACDFRVMAPKSKLVLAFINMGLPGDTGAMYHCVRLIGIAKTTELLMTGKPVSGENAKELGLTTILTDEDGLLDATMDFAKELAQKPTTAIAKQKAMMFEFFYKDLEASNVRESEYMVTCSQTSDFEEAVNAFLEKRKPQFTGK